MKTEELKIKTRERKRLRKIFPKYETRGEFEGRKKEEAKAETWRFLRLQEGKKKKLREEEAARWQLINCLPEIARTKCYMYVNPRGYCGCCNQFNNPENLFELAKTKEGLDIKIYPARPEVAKWSMVDHSLHGHRIPQSKWTYC